MTIDKHNGGAPLLVPAQGEAIILERVPLVAADKNTSYSEAWLQNLIFSQPQCLPVAELDSAYSPLVPVCKELTTSAGSIDVLYATPEGRLVLAEAKLWRNPEARRKVIGQILDYAKELTRWSYEDLQREVRRRTRIAGNALYEIVSKQYPDTREADFVDRVSRSLLLGRFMLLIVGDGIREEAGAIAEFLENFASLDFSFGLVELSMYRIGANDVLVQPRVLVKTLTIKRSVIAVDRGQVVIAEEVAGAADEDQPTVTETGKFYRDFWTEFLRELRLDDASQALPKPNSLGNIFFSLPPSGAQAWITVYFYSARKTVGVFLALSRGEFADEVFRRLRREKTKIEEELGVPVEWSSENGRHRIVASQQFSDLRAKENRDAIMRFLADRVNRFVNVFRPRLARIAEQL